jgi:predicted regulator of Ras-like GTPase activity (Roadblock/LC7/MglB family)
MKRIIVLTLILQLVTASAFGQTASALYEVELLKNPNAGKKDTREVNAVLIFEKDGIKIRSRRSKEIFKEFNYSDIKSAEHAYSKNSIFASGNKTAMALAALSGMSIFLMARQKEKHWLMIRTDDDYAVLKIENDNYRLIRMEFIVKKIDIVDIDEGR